MKLSVIYSIYNRTKLFSRGLKTVDWQSMPKSDFELVIVDDGSTENIKRALSPYIGKMNIRYIRYDHKKHPIWLEMNPEYDGKDENWYHTQAISANIGITKALGDVCCISQPEMLHAPNSFAHGYERARNYKQIFAEVHWGTPRFNLWLEENDWETIEYDELYQIAQENGAEYVPNHIPGQNHFEMYWYVEYFPRLAALHVGGVDLRYQRGVYAEDDQFRARMRMAGVEDRWGGRPNLNGSSMQDCVAIHQSHMDEGRKYKKQNRENSFWEKGAEHNRTLWREFCSGGEYTVANENLPYAWDGQFLITKDEYYAI